MTFTFYGDVVTYYYTRASNRGIARVMIDGISYGTINLYSATTLWQQSTTYSGLGSGIHTIHISIDGPGAGGGSFIDIDAIRVGFSTTVEMCDGNSKYWCSYVGYVAAGPDRRVIVSRNYKGGRDGGAQQWQLQWSRDLEYNGGAWQVVETFPASQWYTNIPLSPYYNHGAQRTRAVNSRVEMLFRFYECAPGCYYWFSPINQHGL